MQIGKAHMKVSVVGGPKLNDGLWHKVGLISLGSDYLVIIFNNVKSIIVLYGTINLRALLNVWSL